MLNTFIELRKIYKGFDSVKAELEDVIKTPACIDHCGRCCTTTQSTTLEALYAASILTGTGKLTDAVQRAENWLLAKHPVAITYEGMLQGFANPRITYEYNFLAMDRCPFLGEQMECTVYDARPAVCRAYGITRTAAGLCPRPLGRGESISRMAYVDSNLRETWEDFKKLAGRKNPEWLTSGFFPTMLYRAARNKEFYNLIKDNKIATAKVIGINVDNTIMWDTQVQAMQRGEFPDLAITK